MALGNFHNYLYFNPLSSLMGNSEQPIVVRLWVQKTRRKALELGEFWRFSISCWNIAGNFLRLISPVDLFIVDIGRKTGKIMKLRNYR